MASVAAAPQPEAKAAAHDAYPLQKEDGGQSAAGSSRPTKSTLAAKLKGALVLALLIIVAALSTTVLRKPLLRSADWLRAQEEAGFAIIGAVGFVFMIVSGSTHLFDVVCGFFCGPLPGFAVSLITKFVATAASYMVGRFLLRDYVMQTYVQEYVWLRAVDRLLQERPWASNFLLRLSLIPAAIKSYGLGALQAPALPFFLAAALCQAALSYVLTDLGAKMQDPADLFKAESKSTQALEIVAMLAMLVVLVGGAYYGKKTVDKLRAEEESGRVQQELKAMGLGEDALSLVEEQPHRHDKEAEAEGPRAGDVQGA